MRLFFFRQIQVALIFVALVPAILWAATDWRLDNSRQKDGKVTRDAFAPAIAQVTDSIVSLHNGAKSQICLGTVVRGDGWILAKESELTEPLYCKKSKGNFSGKEFVKATIHTSKTLHRYDLALVKIPATGLKPISWASEASFCGQWVICASTSPTPAAIGIVSVEEQEVPEQSGFLGVMLEDNTARYGARIAQVLPNSAAYRSGLKVNDQILSIENTAIRSRTHLVQLIQGRPVGRSVSLKINRRGKELSLPVRLGERDPGEDELTDLDHLSHRRSGFPKAFQHDAAITKIICGGPVVGIDGSVIGLNIARAGRTESYALPSALVGKLAEGALKRIDQNSTRNQ